MRPLNIRGFTLVEILVSLTIMMFIFGLLVAILQSSLFFGDLQDKKTFNASKRVASDFHEIFLQYSVYSGSVSKDTSADKYFDRIGLVYSGGTIIIGVTDKSTGNILDPDSNDNGFIGWRAMTGAINVATYSGSLDVVSDEMNITTLRGIYNTGLVRIEAGYDTEIVNGNFENYFSGSLLLTKNINH